jgi:hypothetical protein
MSTPQKRTTAQTWEALRAMAADDDAHRDHDDAADPEADRILALRPDEVRRELAEAGIDPNETQARADRLSAEIARITAPRPIPLHPGEKPTPARASRQAPPALWLLAAAFAAVLLSSWRFAGESIARWMHPPRPAPTILPDTPSPSMVAEGYARKRARDLRAEAHTECTRADWEACTRDLDVAAALDPAGDAESAVQSDRAAARAAHWRELSPPIGPKPNP